MSIIIKGGSILTPRGLVKGDLYIEGNRIVGIGKTTRSKPDAVIDGNGKIAIPGLVNAHTHVSMSIFRGYGEDLPLDRWLKEKIWPIEAKQKPKDVEASALLSFCEMIRSGTTCFADTSLFDASIIIGAARKAGMRGIVARSFLDQGDAEKTKRAMAELGSQSSLMHGKDNPVRLSAAVHAPYTCSEEILLRAKSVADTLGIKLQIHASETRKEIFDVLKERGKYPIEYLDSIGFLGPDCIIAHAGWLTKREIGILGKSGSSIASCPVSNLKLATGGISQITELDRSGANVALGTDSAASNNCLDMFQTMKIASLLQKHHYWKADALPVDKAFAFATANGARALGFDAGALEIGRLADIVLLDQAPNMAPIHDILSNLVYSAGPQNVSDVIIDGKVVMREREIMTLDEPDIIRKAESAAQDIKSR